MGHRGRFAGEDELGGEAELPLIWRGVELVQRESPLGARSRRLRVGDLVRILGPTRCVRPTPAVVHLASPHAEALVPTQLAVQSKAADSSGLPVSQSPA